jgi:outer membrane protein TolC
MFRQFRLVVLLPLLAVALSGCNGIEEVDELRYLKETDEVDYYLDQATSINWPHVEQGQAPEVALSGTPRTLLDLKNDELQNMTLAEVLKLGLENSSVIRSRNAFLSPGNAVLANPERVASFYDPSIQETGVLFGGRGVEAALAAFDAEFSAQMVWGRNELLLNNDFGGGTVGASSVTESGNWISSISKDFGYGGQFAINHNVNYTGSNLGGQLFPSSYRGSVTAQYQHPLLAGAGTEFTQVAGPIGDSFRGISGVTQGVVIARINNDITIADLESSLTDLVKDIEDQYWDLYLQYRLYDTLVTTRNSTLRTWRDAKRKLEIGGVRGFSVEDEAQARDGYFQAQARVQATLSQLYKSEAALRRLIGLPVNDGEIIRPSDEPVTARLEPDWGHAVAEGLTHRVELRRHKWNIKSLELQLGAAKNLVRPRLDFVSSYTVNGFGDQLINQSNAPFSSMYGNMVDTTHTGWQAGFVLNMPLGLRQAQAQVTNIELRLAKARDVLAAQELEVAHELGHAFQQLAEKYVTAQTNFNRRRAAQDRADLVEKKYKVGTQTLDLFLRSLASLADAEVAYYQAIVEYNQAIINLQYRMGTLLPYNQVFLSEGEWDPDAYYDALRRARSRTHALDASSILHAEPSEFVEFDAHWADGDYHETVGATPLVPDAAHELPEPAPAADAAENEVPPPAPENVLPLDVPAPAESNQAPERLPAPDEPARRLAPPAEDGRPLPIVPPGRASAKKMIPAPSMSAPVPDIPDPENSGDVSALQPASLQETSTTALKPDPPADLKWTPKRLPSLEELTKKRPQGWTPTPQSQQRQPSVPRSSSDAGGAAAKEPVSTNRSPQAATGTAFQAPLKPQSGTTTAVRR